MALHHFKSLLVRSRQIQNEIDREYQNRLPDWVRLKKLKKIRLAIKDGMHRLIYQGSSGSLKYVRVTVRSSPSGRFQNT